MILGPAEKVIVNWTILTFDRTKAQPFPLENRHYMLDLSHVELDMASEILAIVDKPDLIPRPKNLTHSESILTISHGVHQLDFGILKYRRLFKPCTPDDIEREMSDKAYETIRLLGPNLAGEYFEDESGKPISMQQMMEHVYGQGMLLFDNAQSVLAIGPVAPRDSVAWTTSTANTISHFLYVTEELARSNWYRSPVSLTYLNSPDVEKQLLEYFAPSRQATLEIIAFVRQLMSADELFNNAVNLYMRHCSHQGKLVWVKHVKSTFNSLRTHEPIMSSIKGLTRQQLIDAFLYGAGIMHTKAEKDAEQIFKQLLAKHGVREVMMAVVSSMRDLVGLAIFVYHPLKQDLEHWTQSGQLAGPDRPDIGGLFPTST